MSFGSSMVDLLVLSRVMEGTETMKDGELDPGRATPTLSVERTVIDLEDVTTEPGQRWSHGC